MTLAANDRSLDASLSAHAPASAGLVLLALAMGGFSIGTTEFASMSLLPYFSAGLGVDERAGAVGAHPRRTRSPREVQVHKKLERDRFNVGH